MAFKGPDEHSTELDLSGHDSPATTDLSKWSVAGCRGQRPPIMKRACGRVRPGGRAGSRQ
jgi:hypothetical protein